MTKHWGAGGRGSGNLISRNERLTPNTKKGDWEGIRMYHVYYFRIISNTEKYNKYINNADLNALNSFYFLLQESQQQISNFLYFLIHHARLWWRLLDREVVTDQWKHWCLNQYVHSEPGSPGAFSSFRYCSLFFHQYAHYYLCFSKKCFQSCQIFSYHPVLGGGEKEY